MNQVGDRPAVWHEGVMCFVSNLTYDWSTRSGMLVMAPNNCTHMPGAIRLFTAIDPNVERIITCYAPTREMTDTIYRKDEATGEWRAQWTRPGYVTREPPNR